MFTVSVPPSKSISNRALVMAILNQGSKVIRNILKCEDTDVMIEAYKELGVEYKIVSENKVSFDIVVCNSDNNKDEVRHLFMGNAGTATRFLLPALCLFKGVFEFDGSERMRERPIKDLVDALRNLGANIKYLGEDGFLPLRLESNGKLSGSTSVKCDVSSQYLSGLLIAKEFSNEKFAVAVDGAKIVSEPYIELTKEMAAQFKTDNDFFVECDLSSASYFFAAGAILKEGICVEHINMKTKQADLLFLDVLKEMNVSVDLKMNESSVYISNNGDLHPLQNYDCEKFPDSAMTLVMLCAVSEGTSKLTGLSTLKYKECDRLRALSEGLKKVGVENEFDDDSITIHGVGFKGLQPAQIETYNDHRIAMCFAVLKLLEPEIEILNPNCVSKTYPTFWDDFNALL